MASGPHTPRAPYRVPQALALWSHAANLTLTSHWLVLRCSPRPETLSSRKPRPACIRLAWKALRQSSHLSEPRRPLVDPGDGPHGAGVSRGGCGVGGLARPGSENCVSQCNTSLGGTLYFTESF